MTSSASKGVLDGINVAIEIERQMRGNGIGGATIRAVIARQLSRGTSDRDCSCLRNMRRRLYWGPRFQAYSQWAVACQKPGLPRLRATIGERNIALFCPTYLHEANQGPKSLRGHRNRGLCRLRSKRKSERTLCCLAAPCLAASRRGDAGWSALRK